MEEQTKFCKYCGGKIAADAVVCTLCGRQVETLATTSPAQPNIVINNANANTNTNVNTNGHAAGLRARSKWVSFFLCLFLGVFGIHKFYEGKIGMGLLYLFTFGLCCIGPVIDLIVLLFKPNPYYC